MSQALGDHVDYYSGSERVFSNTLSVITTVKSAVFEPENLKFWMSSRLESPVGLGEFIEVDTERFWKTSQKDYEDSMEIIPGYQPKNPRLIPAIQLYRQAYMHFHMNSHEPDCEVKALAALEKAVDQLPEDEHLAIQAGLLAFKLEKFGLAYENFKSTLGGKLTPHSAAVRDLFLGRCLDIQGKRSEALALYQNNLSIGEPKLAKAFRKALKAPYRSKEVKKLAVDLHFPDVLEY
jgi:tetratricopeptide (TPR) repeat protein